MPSTSPEQAKTMAAIAHGWKPPKGSKIGKIPLKVAKDFNQADKGTGIRKKKVARQRKTFGKGSEI
ncbi:MAG TPA: hypothetical protein VNS88_15880 [Nitrospiraceae bacterium]|nr:hypothetical protein [Nitrospiraceae bacterium]